MYDTVEETMKILVTGGKGKIGREVCVHLDRKGHEVSVFDKLLDEDYDIRDTITLERFFAEHTPETVVHLAAWPCPMDYPIRSYVANNVIGTLNVAEASLESGIKRLIFTSSTAYYGYESSLGLPPHIPDEQAMSLVDWLRADDGYQLSELRYGISKVCAESLLAYYGLSQQFEVVILRFAPVPRHLKLGLTMEKAVEAIRLAIEYPDPLWYEVFNIGTEPGLGVEKARKILGFNA